MNKQKIFDIISIALIKNLPIILSTIFDDENYARESSFHNHELSCRHLNYKQKNPSISTSSFKDNE